MVGEGNGFELGGESMPGNHILRNSISFNNYAKGVTSNSGPDVQVYNTVSFNNGGTNLSLYTSYKETNYKLDHFVSYNGGKVDDIKLTGQSSLASETNYLDGKNINGESVPSSWFENVDMKNYPTINEKGGFDFNGGILIIIVLVFLLLCTDFLDDIFDDDNIWIWVILIILLLFNFDDGCCC
ncbi:hypothetical protein [uncultured Intestinibacter sp.]|uniref:hypothetical protein n=1 Tax=uncultured Intestinibacter sp. TaxID=1505659 RepID=UPI0027DD196B|nr:hypothetical protein [uncultured Intestinibacter sp.]